MQFVALLNIKPGIPQQQMDAALMRRAMWHYPDGMRVIAEYWPTSIAPAVVSIFETDDMATLMQLNFEWSDVFDITILPAISAEDGLAMGPEVFSKLSRLQNQTVTV